MPKLRADRSVARALTAERRELVVAVRREHPRASAEIILETLVAEGRIDAKAVSARVLRRLLREQDRHDPKGFMGKAIGVHSATPCSRGSALGPLCALAKAITAGCSPST